MIRARIPYPPGLRQNSVNQNVGKIPVRYLIQSLRKKEAKGPRIKRPENFENARPSTLFDARMEMRDISQMPVRKLKRQPRKIWKKLMTERWRKISTMNPYKAASADKKNQS